MPRPDVLMLVLAGGKGSRLDLLTTNRAKPAVHFAGQYRLIDFPLSNCLHSKITDVWIMQQYQPASLNDHLSNGRPWDLDRTSGGMLVLPPYQSNDDKEGFTQGTADGLWRNADTIRGVQPELVMVVSADAVYRMDYARVVREHLRSDAAVTMVTTQVPQSDAGRYGVVQVDGERITDYVYKPGEPASDLISNEVFVFEPDHVLDVLEDIAKDVGNDGVGDLGDALWPQLVDEGTVRQHRHRGYWRDVGTIESYWQANMDFIAEEPPIDLDDDDWPIRTKGGKRSPAWLAETATVRHSLISSAAQIYGTVKHSVLSPGVLVEDGAQVEDSILLPGTIVRSGAVVRRCVIDDSVEIGTDCVIGGDGDITMLGEQSIVPPGMCIEAGGRFPEDQPPAAR